MSQKLIIAVDLGAAVTAADAWKALGNFWHWWRAQLVGMLPLRWQSSIEETLRVPRLILDNGEWRLENCGAEDILLEAALPRHDLREQLTKTAPRAFDKSVDVVIPSNNVLVRRLVLPAAAAARLNSIVRLQLDRLSPFRGDDVQFDCRILSTTDPDTNVLPGAAGEITVEVAMLPRRVLQGIEHDVRQVGLVPRSFQVAGTHLSFAPAGLPWTKKRQSYAFFCLVGGVAWAAAIWLAPILQEAEINDLTSQIEDLAPKVRHVAAVREELTRYQLPSQALSAFRAPAVDVLLDLTKRLPDQARLTSMEMTQERVTLRGTAPRNMNVLGLVKKSALLSHVALLPGPTADNTFALRANLRQSNSTRD